MGKALKQKLEGQLAVQSISPPAKPNQVKALLTKDTQKIAHLAPIFAHMPGRRAAPPDREVSLRSGF